MATGKKSFILHLDSLCVLDEMSFEQKGVLFDAIYKYQLGEEVELDFSMRMAFAPFKNQFIRDNEKYLQFIERQSNNGKKGGRKQETQTNPNNPSLSKEAKPTLNDSVNDSDSVNENDSVNEEDRQGEFSEPSTIFTSLEIELGKEKNVAPKKETFSFKNALLFFVNDEQVVNDYMEVRKKKKGANTETAFKLLMDKINESNMTPIDCIKKCIERNWLSFDIEWLNKSNNNKPANNGKPQKIGGIDIETLKRNHATIEQFKRKEQDSGNNDW